MLKGYLSNPIDCVKPAVATEPGKVYRKDSSFLFYYIRLVFIRLVLVRDPDLVSPFFRDELLAPVLHFVSVDRGEGGLGGKRSVPGEKQGGLQIYNMDSGNVVGLSCRSE
jgi:hypothetical protein